MVEKKIRLLNSANLSRLSQIEENVASSSRQNIDSQTVILQRGLRSATHSATGSTISRVTASSDSMVRRYDMRPQSEKSVSSLGSISGLEGDGSEMDEIINAEKEELEMD